LVQQRLASAVQLAGIPAAHLAQIDVAKLIGDQPRVMQFDAAGGIQLGAGERVSAGRLTHSSLEPREFDRAVHAYLDVHRPRLVLAIEVQIELVEDVQGVVVGIRSRVICRRTRIRR
jgi:hypothetical protein